MDREIPVKPIVYTLCAVVLIYTCLGFFLVPYAGKRIAINNLTRILNQDVAIESIRFNPYTLEAKIQNLIIVGNGDQSLFSVKEIKVNLAVLSLFKVAPVLTEVQVDTPEIYLILNRENQLNISDIIQAMTGDSKTSDQDKGIFEFRMSNLKINNGGLIFSDQIRGVEHKLEKFNLTLPLLTSMEGERQTPARINVEFLLNNATIKANVDSTPFNPAMSAQANVLIPGMDLGPYTGYLPLPPAIIVKAPGLLTLDLALSYTAGTSDETSLAVKASAGLHNLNVMTSDKTPLFSCPLFTIEADVTNFLGDDIKLTKVIVEKPEVHLERQANGQFRILNLLELDQTSQEKSMDKLKDKKGNIRLLPFRFEIARGGINGGTVVFKDKGVTPEFDSTIQGLNFTFENLMIDDQLSAEYDLGFQTQTEEQVSSKGRLSLGTGVDITGRLSLKKIVPKKYLPYYAPFMGDLVNIGQAEVDTRFALSMTDGIPKGQINTDNLNLFDIRLKEKTSDKAAVNLNEIGLANIKVDLDNKKIELGKVNAKGGKIRLHRDTDGRINIIESLEANPILGKKPVGDKTGKKNIPTESDTKDPKVQDSEWALSVKELSFENHHFEFSDLKHREPVNIQVSDININALNLSTDSKEKGSLKASMRWQDKGRISINGGFSVADPGAVLDLSLDAIDVKSFQPYFTDYLKLKISQGHIQSKGQLTVSVTDSDTPEITFKGQGALSDFVSKNKTTDEAFFKCKSLYLSGMDVSVFPVRVNIKEIALTDFYKKATLSENGKFNDREIFVKDQSESEAVQNKESSKNSSKPDINIETITVQGGHINFNDHLTIPNYTANMTEISGRISGLSTTKTEPADVILKGTHGRHSPLDISGRIDPFKEKRFLDLAISFKNIELPEFNTYAMKYLGYEIEKGKLILDLNYNINGNELSSNNHLFFDQFTLGKKVESEDATSLPVELAVSLLKNSRGEIDLDLPIEGKLDDPEFSYGMVLASTFQNLILSVIKAPFKFLGSLFGGDTEELGYVEFTPGSDILDDTSKEKLERLITILADKEKINLEIKGQYDANKDDAGIRSRKYDDLLISYLSEDKKNKRQMVLSQEIRNALIQTAYKEADFPKPREESGREKQISIPEKEKLLFTSIEVKDGGLKRLAKKRSENIMDYILESGKIDPGRIFIHDPESVEQEVSDSQKIKTLFLLK